MDRRRLALLRQLRQPRLRVAVIPREESRKRLLMWASLLAMLLLAMLASTAARADDSGVQFTSPSTPIKVKAGQTAVVPVQVKIAKGWHMFGAQPLVDGMKPASLTLGIHEIRANQVTTNIVASGSGITVLPFSLPRATKVHVEALRADANVYETSFQIPIKVKVDAGASVGDRTLIGQFSYQACSTDRCLFPKKVPFTVTLAVVK